MSANRYSAMICCFRARRSMGVRTGRIVLVIAFTGSLFLSDEWSPWQSAGGPECLG